MYVRLLGPNNLFTLHQNKNRTDFHSFANQIVEPRPDMNIKVTAFTVSKKFYNTCQDKYC